MFETLATQLDAERIRYQIVHNDEILTFGGVLTFWEHDTEFRSFYSSQLAEAPFSAFRWETPALTTESLQQPFEWVLIHAASFANRQSDADTFAGHFVNDDLDSGIVAFSNLRGDATMIVPSPRTDHEAYGHLAAFLRKSPNTQTDALWQVIAREMRSHIGSKPIWLSTAGGGVAWLHVRIDSRPKYYGHTAYKSVRESPI